MGLTCAAAVAKMWGWGQGASDPLQQGSDSVAYAGLDMLAEIAECIGGHSLASVCRLLAEDHAGWSGAVHLFL